MNEHKVWKVLNKENYTEKGIEEMEWILDFFSGLNEKVDPGDLGELYHLLNTYTETSRILGEFLNNEALK